MPLPSLDGSVLWQCVTFNQARAIFGFNGESNIGQVGFPAVQVSRRSSRSVLAPPRADSDTLPNTQAAPSFPDSFPHMFGPGKKLRCLIPCAIDQVRPAANIYPSAAQAVVSVADAMHAPVLHGMWPVRIRTSA